MRVGILTEFAVIIRYRNLFGRNVGTVKRFDPLVEQGTWVASSDNAKWSHEQI
jgi:hypothetical protein